MTFFMVIGSSLRKILSVLDLVYVMYSLHVFYTLSPFTKKILTNLADILQIPMS